MRDVGAVDNMPSEVGVRHNVNCIIRGMTAFWKDLSLAATDKMHSMMGAYHDPEAVIAVTKFAVKLIVSRIIGMR